MQIHCRTENAAAGTPRQSMPIRVSVDPLATVPINQRARHRPRVSAAASACSRNRLARAERMQENAWALGRSAAVPMTADSDGWQATGIEVAALQVVVEGEEPESFWDLFRLG